MTIEVVLASIGIGLYSLNFLLCISMIILISIRIRPLKSNVAILLTCNTYCNALLLNTIMLIMYFYNLLGNLHSSILFNGQWCEIRTYLTHVCFCAFYYSFVLQATFRLFRIVFYQHKFLRSFASFLFSILLQWILSFLFILPNWLLNDFQYLPDEYNCWIAFKNISGLIMMTIIIYMSPLTIILTIYIHIIRYTRRIVHIQQKRQSANQRDLIVLKRIVILVLITVGIGLPTCIIVFKYILTKSVTPLDYHMQGLSISLGVLIGSISLIFINPQIQQVFYKIRPHETMMIEMTRQNGILEMQTKDRERENFN